MLKLNPFFAPASRTCGIDSDTASEIRQRDVDLDAKYCSMCGEQWCAMRISGELLQHAADKH